MESGNESPVINYGSKMMTHNDNVFSKTCVAPIERVKLLLQNQAASHHMAKSGHVPYTGTT